MREKLINLLSTAGWDLFKHDNDKQQIADHLIKNGVTIAKLKPCPFCGGSASEPYYYDPYDGYQGNLGYYRISCSKCSVTLKGNTKQEAIEEWNRRGKYEG